MTETTLHYIFDPLCGWCYGAAPLVKAAQSLPGLKVVPHAGGMMTGNNRRQITDEWRNYVIPHDKRIAEMTGQPFGEAYFNGLLRDTTAVMDSEPPITAIGGGKAGGTRAGHAAPHSAGTLSGRPAHRRHAGAGSVGERAGVAFGGVYRRNAFQQRRADRATHRGKPGAAGQSARRGFPTFALQDSEGRLHLLPAGNYLGNVEARKNLLGAAALA